LIADDHPFLREGVRAVLAGQSDMLVVGEAENGEEAINLYAALQPDVLLLDLQMPVLDGLGAIVGIRGRFPDAKIVILTTYAGDVQASRALRAGAAGYLLKNSLRNELHNAIRSVASGACHLDAAVAGEIALHSIDTALSRREVEVLELAGQGNSNKQIAKRLTLSEDTVKGYMKGVFAKLGVADRTHAVTLAARRGIIPL
jgi:DNA-binding NarL/FixJ family response regulator